MGTRFRPISNYIPKPMMPIGISEKPLLEYIVKLCVRNGIGEMIIVGGYKMHQIQNYFGDGSRFGAKITYVEDKQEGTAGSILRAAHLVDKDFVVYYGDILSDINLREMVDFHRRSKAIATIAISRNVPLEVGVVKLKRNRIVDFVEKPNIGLFANIAIYVLNQRIMEYITELKREKQSIDFAKDVFPLLIRRKEKLVGYLTNCYWNDIGNLGKYEKLDHEEISRIFSWVEG